MLSILRSALSADWADLASEPFEAASIDFSTGRSLNLSRDYDTTQIVLHIEVRRARKILARCSLNLESNPAAGIVLPPFIERLNADLWEDTRDGELLDIDDLRGRFPQRPNRPGTNPDEFQIMSEQPSGGRTAVREALGRTAQPTFVRTQRLDFEQSRRSRSSRRTRGRDRIYDYVDQIQTQVEEARTEYTKISQAADSQFASRALDKSGADPASIAALRAQYDELAHLHRELRSTGLVEETPGVEMGGADLTKAERRFLAVFLDDWRRKLEPLLPVHERLQMLQATVGKKLDRKRLFIDEAGILRIESRWGKEISVDRLSSGEQHLLALFAMLLFSARPRSVVLIDEPEISLHAEWKHAFLDDIRLIAEASDLHVILATHSTGIINGQWDLVEEL